MSAPIVHLRQPDGRAYCDAPVTPSTSTKWRHLVTCDTCLGATRAHALDQAVTVDVQFRPDVPIRYSKLVVWMGEGERGTDPLWQSALRDLERDRAVAGRWCPACKQAIDDPAVLLDMPHNRVVFACRCGLPEGSQARKLYDE